MLLLYVSLPHPKLNIPAEHMCCIKPVLNICAEYLASCFLAFLLRVSCFSFQAACFSASLLLYFLILTS